MKKEIIRHGERGSALIYILIAIALLALLTVTFMEPSGQQTQSQNSFKTVSEMQSQVDFIRSAVQECILLHPNGDVNIPNGLNADKRYPIAPNTPGGTYAGFPTAANRNVANIRCPGNPGDNPAHAAIFGGSTGKFMPPAPALFNDWQWYNSTDGVFFWISTNKTDSFIQGALEKMDGEFAACEADVTTTAGAAVNLDVAGTVQCPANSSCFRVWMVRRTACP